MVGVAIVADATFQIGLETVLKPRALGHNCVRAQQRLSFTGDGDPGGQRTSWRTSPGLPLLLLPLSSVARTVLVKGLVVSRVYYTESSVLYLLRPILKETDPNNQTTRSQGTPQSSYYVDVV